MAQVTLPHTIDAGTLITAVEHQANYTALRDAINGDLEGGAGGNLKADGVTAREIETSLMYGLHNSSALQEGVIGAGAGKVTPGAGLALNYAAADALITDDGGVIASNALLPAFVAGSTVTIAANASGNPRIDQVIMSLTGYRTATVSVLQGTASVGATLDNRTGAANLPAGAIRLADILMPNGFAGPFVQATHIRDRRPWARGAYKRVVRNADAASGNDYNINAVGTMTDIDATNLKLRMEFSGVPVRARLTGRANATASALNAKFGVLLDGSGLDGSTATEAPMSAQIALTAETGGPISLVYDFIPSAGSHTVSWAVAVSAGTLNINASAAIPLQVSFEEILRESASNDGA